MKPEEQRIAIAEACNWKKTLDLEMCVWFCKEQNMYCESDPLQDLNAMHEAEKALSPDQGIVYYYNLKRAILGLLNVSPTDLSFICATAAQRAEAFLRTLNLWKD
jgi:hypothetical protein